MFPATGLFRRKTTLLWLLFAWGLISFQGSSLPVLVAVTVFVFVVSCSHIAFVCFGWMLSSSLASFASVSCFAFLFLGAFVVPTYPGLEVL